MKTTIVANGNLNGVKNEQGKIIIPCKFLDIDYLYDSTGDDKYILCNNEEESILYDLNGNLLTSSYKIVQTNNP